MSRSVYRVRNIPLQLNQSSTRRIYSAMLGLSRGLIQCRPAHDVGFLKQSQLCSPPKGLEPQEMRSTHPSPHTATSLHLFTFRGIMFSTGERHKTAHYYMSFLFGSQLAAFPSRTTLICHQHKSHFPGYCLTSIKETSFVFKAVLPIQNTFLFQNCSPPPLDTIHQATDGSACPQHRLLRRENDQQKSIYALTALALKPTS